MSKYKVILLVLIAGIFLNTGIALAEGNELFPGFTIGGALGLFSSSIEGFEETFDSSEGFIYGLDCSIQLSKIEEEKRIYGTLQYYPFSKSIEKEVSFHWKQTFLDFGGRYSWKEERLDGRMWFGGGISIPRVSAEVEFGGEAYSAKGEAETGFFIEIGGAFTLGTEEIYGFTNIKYNYIPGEVNIGGFSMVFGIGITNKYLTDL
jgi:opacity protein-like surface antigen